jgi:uncharacterized phage protein (TIGR01671 family)
MREIKFRIWDKKLNMMLGSNDIAVSLNLNGEVKEINMMASSSSCLAYSRNNVMDNYELMQFTGLKDKNGKEIYEGDIITNETEIVVSEYGVLDYTGEFQKTKCSVTYNSHFCMFNLTEDVHHGKFEVIGNIYENPELLNK